MSPYDVNAALPLDAVPTLTLAAGSHDDRASGVCAMEAVAWLAGEGHTDHPACTSAVIAEFVRTWNDGLPDKDRTRLLLPLLPHLLNTVGSEALEERRRWRAVDWFVRTHAVAFLRLSPSLAAHADALAALPPVMSGPDLVAAQPQLDAAGAAAWDAARDAAGAAAWEAAWAATWDAAGAAARAAARDAAWAAARAAARDAAWAALAPTVLALQESASSLVLELCAMADARQRAQRRVR